MPERLTKEQADCVWSSVGYCTNSADYIAIEHPCGITEAVEADTVDAVLDSLNRTSLIDALRTRAEQAEAERDTLLDILERLHSVQDGCPLHKYNTVWVKAMEDAQAAFDRAGGGA